MIWNRILIPVNGSESVEEIPLYMTSITPSSDTRNTLLHVLPMSRQADSGSTRAAAIHDALASSGWNVSRELRLSDPVEENVKLALDESVTAALVRHANSPLQVWSADPTCHPAGVH